MCGVCPPSARGVSCEGAACVRRARVRKALGRAARFEEAPREALTQSSPAGGCAAPPGRRGRPSTRRQWRTRPQW
eukprot:1301364-Prymnesium_polylepis.1